MSEVTGSNPASVMDVRPLSIYVVSSQAEALQRTGRLSKVSCNVCVCVCVCERERERDK